MKHLHLVAAVVLAALAFAGPAQGAGYFVRSSPFLSDSIVNFSAPCANARCANYVAGMRIEGSFETSTPLSPNLSQADITASLTAFHFEDGLATYSLADPDVRVLRFEASTDAAGNLAGLSLFLERWVEGTAPHVVGNRMDYLNWNANGFLLLLYNAPCATPSAPDVCMVHTIESSVSRVVQSPTNAELGALPGAPGLSAVTPGDGQATVAFDAPVTDGGLPLQYTATCGAASGTGATSPIVVTGLANGVTVSCSVTASNAFGAGPPSASLDVTPFTVPDAPTLVSVTPGSGQATVAFTPGFDGGSTILGFTATCGAQSATGAGSPLVVTGLANGIAVACTVTATNAAGPGPASAPMTVTPVAVPGAPTIASVTPGNGQATVAFTPPGFDGGSTIVGYTATCGAQSATGAGSPLVVAGLANGVAVACTVTATNAAGTGPASAPMTVTPFTVPDAPTIVSVTPGSGQATVAFTPGFDGGSPITGYTATCGAQGAGGPASPLTVTGLANGTTYTCTVTATNAAGTSAPSAGLDVTPTLKAYSAPSATGSGTITASFTGGGAGCSFSAPQFIPAPPGAPPVPPTEPAPGVVFPHGMFDFSVVGCTPGSTLTFTIAYPSGVEAASYWKYGPTASDPAPHWYVLPATFSGNTVTFSITDGGLGDDDLVANGTIVDQGGPGVGPVGDPRAVPTLDDWAKALLALLLFAAAAGAIRRRA